MSLAAGTRLGPFEIIAPLGAGGMGEVYRARDTTLDRDVAIKVLPESAAGDPHSRERLRLEAMAAASLDHPYICKILEFGEHGHTRFLVMEYVAGDTLHHRLQAGRMPLAEALRVAAEMADALEVAHARGLVHRDLKPANVMLTPQGHVKIMDFGLARRAADSVSTDAVTLEGRPPLTMPGSVLGTPGYMSPEQAKGQPLDTRSDQFAFGVILAEVIGGSHPFRRPSAAETCAAVLGEPPDLPADMPEAVKAVLRRLLAKDAADRYASTTDVRAALARLAAAPPAVTPAGTITHPAPARTPRARLAWAAVLVAAAATLAYGVWRTGLVHPDTGAASIRSIAVLPLDNYSGDPAQDYFAEGMTDELTTDLASISQLRVISRGSAMQFKGGARPAMPEIARRLDVDAVVEGSVRRVGDRVRITAQLIDARADRHLWAKSFERSSKDVLALQDDLASAIAREINVQLTPDEQKRLAGSRSVDPDAYDHYLKGRYFFNRPSDENLKKAIAEFEETVRRSPDFAPAYSGLSDAYLWAGYNEGFMSAAEAKVKARETAEKAVELDPNSAEAHTSLAVFKTFYERDWAGAEREFRRALELNPNYAFAHDQFGMALGFQGRFEEATAEGGRAAELDPLSPQILIDATVPLLFEGDVARVRELADRSAELDPTFFFPDASRGWADLVSGKYADAIEALKKAKALDAPPFVTAWLAYACARAGDRPQALAELEELRRMASPGEVLPFNLAIVYLGLGDHERAIDYLEQAQAADSQMLAWLGQDRLFDPLRSDPRFVDLLRRIGFDRH
jgi:TolB-like protein/Tfp pilus assembly protein PilF